MGSHLPLSAVGSTVARGVVLVHARKHCRSTFVSDHIFLTLYRCRRICLTWDKWDLQCLTKNTFWWQMWDKCASSVLPIVCRTHLSHFQFVANMNVYEHIGHISWDKCDPRQMCPYTAGFDTQASFPLIPSLNSILFSSAHWNSRLGQTLSFIWRPFAAQHGMARTCLIEGSMFTAVWKHLWMYQICIFVHLTWLNVEFCSTRG